MKFFKKIWLTVLAFIQDRKYCNIVVLSKEEYQAMCDGNCGTHDIPLPCNIDYEHVAHSTVAVMVDTEFVPKHWTISQLTFSQTAVNRQIDNRPCYVELENLYGTIEHLLDLIAEMWYDKYPNRRLSSVSGYRNWTINRLVGGSATSDHPTGRSADITTGRADWNRELMDMIRDNFEFDQLYAITGRNSGAFASIHVSYRIGANRNQLITV